MQHPLSKVNVEHKMLIRQGPAAIQKRVKEMLGKRCDVVQAESALDRWRKKRCGRVSLAVGVSGGRQGRNPKSHRQGQQQQQANSSRHAADDNVKHGAPRH